MPDPAPGLRSIPSPTALEAVPGFATGDAAAPPPAPGQTPRAYLEALAGGEHWPAAGAFLAAALPRREAVWWACRCARATLDPAAAPPEAEAALRAAEAWAAAPGDVNRRKALPAAEAADLGSPAGCAALAAFLSGGSLVPPPLKEVPPPAGACARAVAGAVTLAAAAAPAAEMGAFHRQFLQIGLAVADGVDRWPDPR